MTIRLEEAERIMEPINEKAMNGEPLTDIEYAARHFAGKYYRLMTIRKKMKDCLSKFPVPPQFDLCNATGRRAASAYISSIFSWRDNSASKFL